MAVYMVLLGHRNDQGLAWPSVTTIANAAHSTEKTARAALEGLRELGLIVLLEAPTPRSSGLYYVIAPEQTKSGNSDRPERYELPPKSPEKYPEENKNARIGAHTREVPTLAPDRGASTAPPSAAGLTPQPVLAPGSGPRSAQVASNEEVFPERATSPRPITRAERSSANKAAWSLRPRHYPGPKAVAPRAAHKPYQLPLPNGTPISDMSPEKRTDFLRSLKKALPWVGSGRS